jgi:hypothetical protein
MQPRYDIGIDKDYMNANNDISWNESDIQHIEDTIELRQGECKEFPNDGVSIGMYLNSQGMESDVARKTIIELQKDLYICNNPLVSYSADGTLIINPNVTI